MVLDEDYVYDDNKLINGGSDGFDDDQGNGGTQTPLMLWGRLHEQGQLQMCLMHTLSMVNPVIFTSALAKVGFFLNFDYHMSCLIKLLYKRFDIIETVSSHKREML